MNETTLDIAAVAAVTVAIVGLFLCALATAVEDCWEDEEE